MPGLNVSAFMRIHNLSWDAVDTHTQPGDAVV